MNARHRAFTAGAALVLALGMILTAGYAAGGQQTVKNPPLASSTVPPQSLLLKKPDLVILKIWFAKWVENPKVSSLIPITTDLKLGEKVWMVCDLTNKGTADSTGLWLLGFYIDDTMKWNNSWGDLGVEKPLTGFGPYTPDALGIHNYKCVLDVNKQINEIHEDNNVKEILFKVVK